MGEIASPTALNCRLGTAAAIIEPAAAPLLAAPAPRDRQRGRKVGPERRQDLTTPPKMVALFAYAGC